MVKKIVNPQTGRKVNLSGIVGKRILSLYGGGKVDKQPYVKVRNSLSQWLESEQAYKDFDANPFAKVGGTMKEMEREQTDPPGPIRTRVQNEMARLDKTATAKQLILISYLKKLVNKHRSTDASSRKKSEIVLHSSTDAAVQWTGSTDTVVVLLGMTGELIKIFENAKEDITLLYDAIKFINKKQIVRRLNTVVGIINKINSQAGGNCKKAPI